jgi:hypothetical protein
VMRVADESGSHATTMAAPSSQTMDLDDVSIRVLSGWKQRSRG